MSLTCFYWTCFGLYILLTNKCHGVKQNTKTAIGYLNITFSYSNPNHQSNDGFCDITYIDRWCDVYFIICIDSKSTNHSVRDCNILHHITKTHRDLSDVKYDNENALLVNLYDVVPKSINIYFKVYDEDRYTRHDLIAKFQAKNVELLAANKSKSIQLFQQETSKHNTEVRMEAEVTLVCNNGYYENYCQRACFPDITARKLGCASDGTLICVPGFRGLFCEKPDACFYKPCTPDSVCQNIDFGLGYHCSCNGSEERSCYLAFNPCVPSPCENYGQCIRIGVKHESYECKCSSRWTGKHCTKPQSACEFARKRLITADLASLFENKMQKNLSEQEFSVCKNNGICINDPDEFKFSCKCQKNWVGELCEISSDQTLLITSVVSAGILIIVIFGIIPCAIHHMHRKRRPKRGYIYKHYNHQGINLPGNTNANRVRIIKRDDLSNEYQNEYDYCDEFIPLGQREKNLPLGKEYDFEGPPLPDRPQTLTLIQDPVQYLEISVLHDTTDRIISTSSELPLLSEKSSINLVEERTPLPTKISPEQNKFLQWLTSPMHQSL